MEALDSGGELLFCRELLTVCSATPAIGTWSASSAVERISRSSSRRELASRGREGQEAEGASVAMAARRSCLRGIHKLSSSPEPLQSSPETDLRRRDQTSHPSESSRSYFPSEELSRLSAQPGVRWIPRVGDAPTKQRERDSCWTAPAAGNGGRRRCPEPR
jgi:hypothetical protein